MPIPLAKRNINLQAPQAQAGQAFDPSASIERMGQVAANTLKAASGAVNKMGEAIVLRERQNDDFIGKSATLKREEAFTEILSQLEQHQGLDAEQWMQTKGNDLIKQAIIESNKSLNQIKHSDIHNEYTADSIDAINTLKAKTDNYVYKERLNAQNTMSKDIIEYHKRTAKMNAANYYSPNKELRDAARASFDTSRAAIKKETLTNAAQNGLTDPTYLKLKVQENDDEFFVEMADEISQLQGGLSLAQQFINENVGKVTTAAIDKAQKSLEEDLLVDSIMKDPMSFVKNNGEYDMDKAYSIAPNLNDRDRRRIVYSSIGAAKSAMKNGAELGATDLKMLNAWGEKIKQKTREMFNNMGWMNEDTADMIRYLDKDSQKAYKDSLKETQKGLTIADTFRFFYDNFENVAKSTIVIDKTTGEEVRLPENPTEAALMLINYSKQPGAYIIQDQAELAGYNLAEQQRKLTEFLNQKGFDNEPARGFIKRESYSTFDAITSSARDTFGLNAGDMPQVFRYMQNHLKETIPTEDGKTEFKYKYIQNFDFYKKGAYDDLVRINAEPMLRDIQNLYTEAIQDTLGSGNKRLGIASQSPDSIVVGNLADYIKNRKRMTEDEYIMYRKERAYNIAGWLGK